MSGAYFENLGGTRRVQADTIELNSLDGSRRYVTPVGLGGTPNAVTLTRANAAGKTVLLNDLAGVTVTLPAATGGGDIYRVLSTVIPTSNSDIIQVANASDTMVGIVNTLDDTSDNSGAFVVSGTDDTITMNRTTTGGNAIGEWFEFEDIAANLWLVRGQTYSTGAFATPASAAVS
jgi:hypothetical protein